MIEKIKKNLEDIVNNDDVYIDNVEYVKEDNSNILRVTIDSNTKEVDLNLCVDVTRLINEYLDENDVIADEYMLEVSSKGIDEVDVNEELDINDMIDQCIFVKTYAKINNVKEFSGELKSIEEDGITIMYNNELMKLTFKQIAIIKECSTEEEL